MNIATWTADFGIDVPGVSLQWQFAFAGYSDFASGTQVGSDLVNNRAVWALVRPEPFTARTSVHCSLVNAT